LRSTRISLGRFGDHDESTQQLPEVVCSITILFPKIRGCAGLPVGAYLNRQERSREIQGELVCVDDRRDIRPGC